MDFLKGKIRPIYFRYLAAAFGTKRGSARPDGSEDPYFTVSVLGSLGLALLAWAGLLWLAMPITEALTAVYAVMAMRSCTNALPMEA